MHCLTQLTDNCVYQAHVIVNISKYEIVSNMLEDNHLSALNLSSDFYWIWLNKYIYLMCDF